MRIYQLSGNQKTCTNCGQLKSFAEFSANRALKTGLQSHCKVCKAARLRLRRSDPAYREQLKQMARRRQPLVRLLKRKNIVREMLSRAKARARKRGLPFAITSADVVIPAVCPVFGVPFARGNDGRIGADGKIAPNSPSLDCINPLLGYVPGNVQVLSNRANSMKSNATPDELRRFAHWILGANSQ